MAKSVFTRSRTHSPTEEARAPTKTQLKTETEDRAGGWAKNFTDEDVETQSSYAERIQS